MKGRFFVSFSGLLNHLLASQVTALFVFITSTIIDTSSWPILVVLECQWYFFMGDGFQAESYTYMLTWCHIKLLLVWLVLIDGFDGGSWLQCICIASVETLAAAVFYCAAGVRLNRTIVAFHWWCLMIVQTKCDSILIYLQYNDFSWILCLSDSYYY